MKYGLFDNVLEIDGMMFNSQWMEWYHWGVPNEIGDDRLSAQIRLAIRFHCRSCTSLDGCYFMNINMPRFPAHKYCDCELLPISSEKVLQNLVATCSV